MNDKAEMLQRAADFFPHKETIPDVSGLNRNFVLSLEEAPLGGYIVRATELATENGYEFESYSETSPFNALASVREKLNKGLATKYLLIEEDRISLRFDEFQGRISSGGIVIDGKLIPYSEFCKILQVYEGFTLDASISDLSS